MSNYDGQMSEFYNRDKDELYEIKDADARSDISNLQQNKVDKVSGKGLSTNDYTTEEKNKLSGIEMYADDNNVWFCIVDSVEFTENTYVDYYMHAVNRTARWTGELGRERFIDGDIFFVFFNGVDIDQLGVNPPYYLVRFFIEETPSQTSEKHPYIVNVPDSSASEQALTYWNPHSLRTFVFKKTYSGNTLRYSLMMAYSAARLDNTLSWQRTKGEVSLSDSLDYVSHSVAATSYAVKRLKDMIDSIGGGTLSYEVVQTLPRVPNISTTTMYLLPKQTAGTQNVYDEYLNPTGLNDGWELLGDTEIDLSNYYTKTETDTLLGGKVDKVTGKGLSTEDYTTAEKNKLSGIATGAEVNVQTDWNQSDSTADDYLKNKPTIPSALSDLTDDSSHRVVTDTEKSTWSGKISDNPTFTEASTRANIASGESFATILGKIKKFFTDLKTVAFTGSYNDLTDKPTSPTDTWRPMSYFSDSLQTQVQIPSDKPLYFNPVSANVQFEGFDTGTEFNLVMNVDLSGKQNTLVSGTNIKTVNGNSILGAGDITTPDTKPSGWMEYEWTDPVPNLTAGYGHSCNLTKGIWLVYLYAYFSTNANGYRYYGLTKAGDNTGYTYRYCTSQPAVNGSQTCVTAMVLVNVTSTTEAWLTRMYHNAGTNVSLSVINGYKAIKLM